GTPVEAACRIVILEDQLEEAQRINAEYRRAAGRPDRGGGAEGRGSDG
ncbi:MerR family transcriptional regulator, partial [Streptomyces subrutilus]